MNEKWHLTSHNKRKYHNEPIRSRCRNVQPAPSAGRPAQATMGFGFALDCWSKINYGTLYSNINVHRGRIFCFCLSLCRLIYSFGVVLFYQTLSLRLRSINRETLCGLKAQMLLKENFSLLLKWTSTLTR